jgi:peptide/nickel transport system substrate-binding protein
MGTCVSATPRRTAATAVALAAVLMAGCGQTGSGGKNAAGPPKAGGSLALAQTAEFNSLDPAEATGVPSLHVVAQINEPLFWVNAKEQVVPYLASSFKSSSNLRHWTFYLRPGVRFSTDKPMTAADVVFSLDKLRKNANWGFMFEEISSVEARSPLTVVITTKKPEPALVSELAIPSAGILPDNYGGKSEKEFAQHPIGTGPFKYVSWVRGQALTLERNPYYWQHERPYLDRVIFKGIPEASSRVSQLQAGDLDAIQAPPFSQIAELERAPGIKVEKYAYGRDDYMFLNTRNPLFRDARAREAAYLAIDRPAIIHAALNGYGKPAGSMFPATQEYYDPNIKAPARDIATAKKLMAEAVSHTGAPPKTTLIYLAGDIHWNVTTQIIQQNLEEAGLKVKLQPLDESALQEAFLGSGEYEALVTSGEDEITDPVEEVGFTVGTKGFKSGEPMTEVTKLAGEAGVAVDPHERRQLYTEIQELWAKQKFQFPLNSQPNIWAMKDRLVGVEVTSTGIPDLVNAGYAG